MKVILLVVEGPQSKYAYLKKIASTPYRIILVKNQPSVAQPTDWHREYIADEDVIDVPCRNPTRVNEAVKQYLHRRGMTANGVLTYRDTAVLLTQYLAEALSLPPICRGDAYRVRNKGAMRSCLRDAGLSQPDFRLCNSRDEAVSAAEDLGAPLVMKPAEMVSSLGVQKLAIPSPDLVRAAFDQAVECDFESERLRYEFNLSPQVMVERFIEAVQEISVEGLVVAGVPKLLAITKKRVQALPGMEFAEVGHAVPFILPAPQRLEIETTVKRALSALQMQNSAFHAELLLRADQPPVITEVGARLAGDFIPMLVESALGVDFIEAAVTACTGEDITLATAEHPVFSAIDFVSASTRPMGLREALLRIGTEPNVVEATEYPGAAHGRLGHIRYTGNSVEDLDRQTVRFRSMLPAGPALAQGKSTG